MKEVVVRFIEKSVRESKNKIIDYTSTGFERKEDGFTIIEFEEKISEFDLSVTRTVSFSETEVRQLRIAEKLAFENELLIFGNMLAKGHYICRFEPKLSSVLDAEIFEMDFSDDRIHINYDLYAQGIFLGNYDTQYILIEEIKKS